ncbi:MAG TPA: CARDB domain-containing protein, partial [Thermoleophilia bacterium]|nr:CARDB domain-containing protein [Thermoleophilia bacterium]
MSVKSDELAGGETTMRRRGAIRQTSRVAGTLMAVAVLLALGVAAIRLVSADPSSPFSITKTDSADPVESGAVLTYTITVVNTASAKVDNVIMTDQVNHLGSLTDPPALPQLSLTSTKGNCTQSYFQAYYLVSCSAGSLRGGESWTVTISGKVTAPSGMTINNTASVTGTKSAQNFTSSTTATTQVANNPSSPLADLTVNKAGPSNVVAGSPLLYTLTVNNTGAANATDIRVVDTLPAGVALTSASGNSLFVCTPAGPIPPPVTVVCDGGRVNAGSNATITINATAPAALGPITNTAVVDPNQTIPESNDLNNTSAAITTTVTSAPAPAALTITKTDDPDPVVPGGTLTYSIHVENTGSGPNSRADDVVVVDGTQGLQAASITASMVVTNGVVGNTGGCTVAAPQVTCKIRSLNAGGTMDVTITGQVIADAGTTVINTATVTGNIRNTGVSATATAITEVKPAVDLSITKVDSPDPVCSRSWPLSPFGGPAYPPIPPLLAPPVCLGGLTYTLVVGNSGISTATGVVVRDELAEGLVFDSFEDTSAAGFVCALDPTDPKPNVVKCDGGTIGPGATATIKILVVAPPTTGAINNKAEVDPYNAIFEADETNNVVFESTGVSTGIDLVIRKHDEPEDPPGAPIVTDGFDPIATSGTQTYTLFVDNVGTQNATNIRVHDYLPANTILLSAEGDHGFVCSYVAKSPLASHYVECEQGAILGTASEFYPPLGLPGDDFATIKIKIFAMPVVAGPTGPMHNEAKVDPLHEIAEANELNNIEFEDTIVTVGGASLSAYNQLKITKTQIDPAPATQPGFVPPADASYVVATNGILIYNI